jgi:hypothetical protein
MYWTDFTMTSLGFSDWPVQIPTNYSSWSLLTVGSSVWAPSSYFSSPMSSSVHCLEARFGWLIQGSLHSLSSHYCGHFVLWSNSVCLHMATLLFTDRQFLAVCDAVLTPFLNPVIYTFRNKEMKAATMRIFKPLMMFVKIS